MEIDLNADLGEGCGTDESLLDLVSSANIACGWHAGGADVMHDCARWAVAKGVSIGAHPSFLDRENFGRSEMDLTPDEVYAGMLYQLGALSAIAQSAGGRISHLKPHGALYNQAARDQALANAIVNAVRDFDPGVAIFGLAGGKLIDAARQAGLWAVEEAFADRGYQADGSLVPRSAPGALIHNEEEMIARIVTMIREKRVKAIDGSWCSLNAQTLCLHGDGPHALAFARRIRKTLDEEGIAVRARADLAHPVKSTS